MLNYGLIDRRRLLRVGGGSLVAATIPTGWAIAQAKPIKVGLMLPYSGTFAQLGENITHAVEMLIAEKGGTLGGRPVQFIRLDDESKPEAGPQNAERLVKKDNVDVLIGTVHSGVQMGIHKVVRESGTLTIIPNAGNNDVTRSLCARNVFRTSFTNWQPAYGMGLALAKKGVKRAAFVTWDYAAGQESGAAFKEGFEKGGGTFVRLLTLNFPETNFQPLLAQIPGLNVDAVGSFFAGGGAVQFVKEYAAAQLKPSLCGPGFLTEGTLPAQGKAAEGIETALHYGDNLSSVKNDAFMKAFRAKAGRDADVYAVQGYDAAQLLAVGLDAVKGDLDNEAGLYKAMRGAKLESPRGPISFSDSQNVVQNIYLRRVENGQNKVVGVAVEALADPGTGCKI
ncbi:MULTISPECIES: ABC transporter substrate-binding protein [unclassified Beijerinckia]|uniref:ABC transporter substrate-binding protein n=1 Tax=unclassified Beijerinckia TaxID=2638183 RepID=UPI00089A1B19|nr:MULTISPECIES: ABC transporter substrate-binding protein [unclassified Beijerinckia]MDH7798632.1 branched-chain amino acid transport system substrate-binding protein [Beijerinckia sp. GAS462]SED27368.1 amino acid/amide ABC transporter substrate-binding protein, HAAT family [Beijerinckia sp. 28-YEA-48]